MAGHQIPSGSQGLRASGIDLARPGYFEKPCLVGAVSLERRGYLRGNGPVGVRFPLFSPDFAGSRRMSSSDPNTSRHIPVLGHQAVALLPPRDGGIYVDATFGAGGYSRMILETPGTRVIGIDRDRTAIMGGFDLVDQSAGRLTLVEDQFSNLAEICVAQGQDQVDGIVMDIGVSSMQLDQADRGFSFRLGGPLDMRMSQDGPTAADVVTRASEVELA